MRIRVRLGQWAWPCLQIPCPSMVRSRQKESCTGQLQKSHREPSSRTFQVQWFSTRSSEGMMAPRELQYVSGPPFLVKSAMDAVQLWRYRADGRTDIDTTIEVVFPSSE